MSNASANSRPVSQTETSKARIRRPAGSASEWQAESSMSEAPI